MRCRLELNNSGAWKLLGTFDTWQTEAAERIARAADELARALNARESGRTALLTLRMATDESHPRVLRRWSDTDGWQEVTPHT